MQNTGIGNLGMQAYQCEGFLFMTTRKNLSKIKILSTISILFMLHFYKKTMGFSNISFLIFLNRYIDFFARKNV
jgi:hypothetical protein